MSGHADQKSRVSDALQVVVHLVDLAVLEQAVRDFAVMGDPNASAAGEGVREGVGVSVGGTGVGVLVGGSVGIGAGVAVSVSSAANVALAALSTAT